MRHFDKVFSQISDDEYLFLVAMLVEPNQFNVLTAPQEKSPRMERIKAAISDEY